MTTEQSADLLRLKRRTRNAMKQRIRQAAGILEVPIPELAEVMSRSDSRDMSGAALELLAELALPPEAKS